MSITVITPAAAEPITVAEARKHCRIDADISEHDDLLGVFIQAARERAEQETGRALITRTVRLIVPATARLVLRPAPLGEVTEVKLIDEDGAETTVAAGDRRLDQTGPLPVLLLNTLTAGAYALQVTMTVGYGTSGDAVPAAIRSWILMQVAALFENRESVVVGQSVNTLPLPFVDGLLDPFRVHPGF